MELRQQIPTGCIKQFGQFGVPYVVGEVAEFLPDGDVLVNITLLQSGEKIFIAYLTYLKIPKLNKENYVRDCF